MCFCCVLFPLFVHAALTDDDDDDRPMYGVRPTSTRDSIKDAVTV